MTVWLQASGAQARTAVSRAAEALRGGKLAVIPTDTVYGVAAHPDAADAAARLYAAKGRAADKPVALLAADLGAVERWGAVLPAPARRLAEAYWPGPLTLVLRVRGASGAGAEEGFRVPACALTQALLRACGGVLRVSSANRSGAPPALTAAEAAAALGEAVDVILDAGPAPGGVASTVVRVAGDTLEILREGAVRRDVLARGGCPALTGEGANP
ncbi:MAG: threonylcarbamoyl-AMP synthase [Lentisphaerae bacterium]|nr:threonylcarbamoyl-AMP synthase [Lentisphaerota bacterium]